jgi:hypothetical protein
LSFSRIEDERQPRAGSIKQNFGCYFWKKLKSSNDYRLILIYQLVKQAARMREDEKYRFWLMILEEKLKNNNLLENKIQVEMTPKAKKK